MTSMLGATALLSSALNGSLTAVHRLAKLAELPSEEMVMSYLDGGTWGSYPLLLVNRPPVGAVGASHHVAVNSPGLYDSCMAMARC
jgi:hypothetical protein